MITVAGRVGRVRWAIISLVSLGTVVNYLARSSLAQQALENTALISDDALRSIEGIIAQIDKKLTELADARLDDIDTTVPDDVLVARPVFDVRVTALPVGALAWLDALAAGRTLGDAFAMAHASSPHTDDGALFALLLAHGLAVAFDLPPES